MEPVVHIVLLPAMAHGHMIPTLDMAKLFNSRGLKTTIIATPSFADSIKRAQESGHDVGLRIVNFPPEKSSLPDNIVSLDQMATPDLIEPFLEAIFLLQEPVEKLLQELSPSCLVSDTFLPWTLDSAAKLGIPRLVFHGISCRALCALEQMDESDQKSPFPQQMRAADRKSYGVIINSFHELEPARFDYYKNITGKKAWHIGPLLLCNKNKGEELLDLSQRGKASSIDEHECLSWLGSKRPDSVVYVCFGSIVTFTRAQLHEIAAGLEASGQDFIWVVRHEDRLPRGFEERTRGKGLIITGWAPQVMILGHPSTGAFVTHCGWNSTLEGICAGVPMVTWPAFAEQFRNEKMVTEDLGIGVSVGNERGCVPREVVEAAVRRIMVAEEMRSQAKCYMKMAREAVEEGGSSYHDLSALIDELSIYATPDDEY